MKKNSGFTLIELVIVMGIIMTLFSLSAVSIVGLRQKASLNTTIDSLITDLKSQQLKAMIGESEGRASSDVYGIYFETNDYVLFHGGVYLSSSPDNFVVKGGDGVQFSSTFSGHQIVFSQTAGEVVNFVIGNNMIAVSNTVSGEHKTITINRYGVITGIN